MFSVLTIAALTALAGGPQSQAVPIDPVVAEIRALRADMNQRLEANIRAQLLLGRLQLQEQRITTLSKQLIDVENRLRENETARGQIEQGLKMFGNMAGDDAAANKEGGDFLLGPLKAGLEKVDKTDADLKLQQTQLMGMIAEEQSRWSAFNARLDELEKLLTGGR